MGVDTSTFAADAKNIYGVLKNQVGQVAKVFNLFRDGTMFAKPINEIGINGYTFLARLKPNYQMGYRPEGTTGVGAAGNQGLAQSTVSLKYVYVPTVITGQAENLTKGNYRAFLQAKALETKYDMGDILSHINVIVAGAERGGQLAQVLVGSAGSFTASRATNLPGALYLHVGMPIDTGPVGGGTNTITNATITAITYDQATSDTVTVPGTATAGNAVYLAGEAPPTTGAFPYTVEGFVSLIAPTGARQGLNPATAGQETWAAYQSDVGNVAMTSQLLMELIQFVQNRGGVDVDGLFFPSAQINQMTLIATQNLRYNVDNPATLRKKAIDLGISNFQYGTRTIIEDKDIRNDRIYAMASSEMAHFIAVPLDMADDEAGSWTRVFGASGVADAIFGLMRMYHQIATTQRSALGTQKNYQVPVSFAQNPASLA